MSERVNFLFPTTIKDVQSRLDKGWESQPSGWGFVPFSSLSWDLVCGDGRGACDRWEPVWLDGAGSPAHWPPSVLWPWEEGAGRRALFPSRLSPRWRLSLEH